MILGPGHWLGRGSVLIEGFSLGKTVACDARIEQDENGLIVNAELKFQDGDRRNLGLRIAGNEVGTYTLRLQTGGEVYHGTAKLDSPPNLGLLWNESETEHLTCALFAISGGFGCRGFLRETETTYTWEVAFALKQDVVTGDNVVSLRSGRPRRR
jgi:hypothetical protein